MDAAHEIELQRIIENRRRRGSLHSIHSSLLGSTQAPPSTESDGLSRHASEAHGTQTQSSSIMSSRGTNVNLQRAASRTTTTTTTEDAKPAGSASPPRVPVSRKYNSAVALNTRSFYLDPNTGGRGGADAVRQQQAPPSPQPAPRPSYQPRSSVSFLSSTATASADATAKLREAQALQERKVDQLQDDLRKGLQDIRQVLQEVLQEQRQVPVTAPPPPPLMHQGSSSASELLQHNASGAQQALQAKRVLSGFGGRGVAERGQQQQQQGYQESFRDRGTKTDAQHLVTTPKDARGGGRAAGGSSQHHFHHQEHDSQYPMTRQPQRYRSGQETNLRKADSDRHLDASVIPGRSIPSFEGSSRYENELRRQATSNHYMFSGGTTTGDERGPRRNERAPQQFQVGAKPSQPPINTRPFSKTTIDAQSSLTILAEGEWWYKWDSSGHKVHLRWVWMDATRRSISWSPKQLHENPMFGPRIPIEEMVRVTTTQIAELDPHGNPRTFYVLLIECSTRLLQLGTERRDKLDVWYEAIQNVIQSVRQAAQSRVASALSSE